MIAEPFVVDRSDRGAVLVHGPEALTFLQSLISADIGVLQAGEGVHTLLLTPQGKLDVDFRLLRVGDECWLDAEAGFGAQLAASLNRFRIRVKVEVEDRSESWGQLAIRGPKLEAFVPVPGAHHAHVEWNGCRVVRADWGALQGVDIVGPQVAVDAARAVLVDAGVAARDLEMYEAARIAQGIPRQGYDLDERTIPQEAFLELDAVSFTKGCFLGQELVCRIDTRGHVNRYLRHFALSADAPPGSEVVVDTKVVGELTSVSGREALGYVRREIEPPADVLIRLPDGATAPARTATLSPLA